MLNPTYSWWEGGIFRGFDILSPQLGAYRFVTKCLRPLYFRCQRRRRLHSVEDRFAWENCGSNLILMRNYAAPVWLIPTILAGSSGPFASCFPHWSPLRSLYSKARPVAPTALSLHKGSSENLLRLLSRR